MQGICIIMYATWVNAMKQLYMGLSLLFVLPSGMIANGRHCRRHCPRRMICQPARSFVAPVQPPVVPAIAPVQQIAEQPIVVPVTLPQPEVVITQPAVLVTRTPVAPVENLKSYITYIPHALLAVFCGISGFGAFKRYKARQTKPNVPPVPPVKPQTPKPSQATGAGQGPVNGGVPQPNVTAQQPNPVILEMPVPVEQDIKKEHEPVRPQAARPSQQEIDGKTAQQQGYEQAFFTAPVIPEIEVAVPDVPGAMPIPAAQQDAAAPVADMSPVAPNSPPSPASELDQKHSAAASADIASVPVVVVQDNRDYKPLGDTGFCSERFLGRRG
jgi:hypothetical protein